VPSVAPVAVSWTSAILAIPKSISFTTPSVVITTNLVESAAELGAKLDDGSLQIPPPPASVADWPIVGERLHGTWAAASRDLEAAIAKAGPSVKAVGAWLLEAAAAAGFGALIFVLSVLVAGVLLANGTAAAEQARRLVDEVGHPLPRGPNRVG